MIVIAGSGIAGLTLANALEQLDLPYRLCEQQPEQAAVGAGIILQQNALAVLGALGIDDDMPGARLRAMRFGTPRVQKTLNFSNTGTSRPLALHRHTLMQRLRRDIPDERLRYRCQISGLQTAGDSLLVQTPAGDIEASTLVVANGAGSALHAVPQPRSSRQWCWRAVLPYSGDPELASEQWFGQHRLGIVPLDQGRAYVFHVMSEAGDQHSGEHLAWLQAQQARGEMSSLDFTDAEWLSHPLAERAVHWGSGRCVAIGDAAHAMTPNMGLGAATAIEDAWCLATLLRDHGQQPKVAERLAEQRHKRISAMQKQSWQMGHVAHWQSAPLRLLRDTGMRLMPSALMSYQQNKMMQSFAAGITPLTSA